MTKITLENQIKEKKQQYKTDSYPMSLGELINLYKDNELIINPDFQRYFRWTKRQRSRLIESIILGIPIPSIFVYQTDDGIWEVVDGLQRVSTILEFVGELKNEEESTKFPQLVLEGIENLKLLNGQTWDSIQNTVKLDFKRAKFKIEIIQKESDPLAKFEVFMRLNTGGSNLSDQELRNTWLVMYNKDFYNWLGELSNVEDFKNCISLSEKLLDERYDMELVLCYLVYPRYYSDFSTKEKQDLLTDSLKEIATFANDGDFNYAFEKEKFIKTFEILNNVLGDEVFRQYDFNSNRFRGRFLESAFEAISIGISENLNDYDSKDENAILIEKIKNIWKENNFVNNMGSGTNTKTRVPKVVPFGIKYFKKNGKN